MLKVGMLTMSQSIGLVLAELLLYKNISILIIHAGFLSIQIKLQVATAKIIIKFDV
jgi:hypothetical protein